MQLIPYLNFDGHCREAFDLYCDALRGEIIARFTYGQSPMASEIGAATLMGADGPPPHPPAGQGTCVNINVDSIEEAERIYAALCASGTVQMPIQETFWAHRWAALTDRFGKPWMINCMKPSS